MLDQLKQFTTVVADTGDFHGEAARGPEFGRRPGARARSGGSVDAESRRAPACPLPAPLLTQLPGWGTRASPGAGGTRKERPGAGGRALREQGAQSESRPQVEGTLGVPL